MPGTSGAKTRLALLPRHDEGCANPAKLLDRHPRQMDGIAHRLFHQVERIEQDAEADELAGPELREMREAQADRLVRIQRGEGVPHQRRRGIHAQHDRFSIEAVDPNVLGDLMDDFQHRRLGDAGLGMETCRSGRRSPSRHRRQSIPRYRPSGVR